MIVYNNVQELVYFFTYIFSLNERSKFSTFSVHFHFYVISFLNFLA